LKKTEDDQRFSRGNLRLGARPPSFAARSKNRAAEWNWGAEQRRDRIKTERRIQSEKNQIDALRLTGKILRKEIEELTGGKSHGQQEKAIDSTAT
jgi:hypothetical protein